MKGRLKLLCWVHTLDLLALFSFKLQHSQLVSLWKFSHCGYKKWCCHFYSCQINKSDIWLQFEKNEKNPPDGADMQKNQKQILKLLYLHYWRAPRGPRGVKRGARIHWIRIWRFGALIWTLNCRNFEKVSKFKKNHQKTMFSYSFSKIMQFKLHTSAPNL